MHHSDSNTQATGNPANPSETGPGPAGLNTTGLTEAGQGRRTFIGAAAAALLAGAVIQITGCSSDDKGTGNPNPGDGSKAGAVLENHASPHKAVITKAQLDAGGGLTLDIQGLSGHSHSITLNADQVATIKAGEHAMTSSTTYTPPGGTGHGHVVMFN
jgi:hypothetical protein